MITNMADVLRIYRMKERYYIMEFWAFIVASVLAALVVLSPIFNFKETIQQYRPHVKQGHIETDFGESKLIRKDIIIKEYYLKKK